MDYNRKRSKARVLAVARRAIRALSAKSINVQIKRPPFYDISHWIIVNDWYSIAPVPLLMGTKATESDNYKDPTFPEYFTNMRDIVKCNRLAYHFFRKAADPVKQANWFIDYIEPYITVDDVLALDFEEGGETAPQLWAFLDRCVERRPDNLIVIYSRKNLMDPIVMTESEKAFFKMFPSWPAGYPTDPDPYTTTPVGYIPDQTKWGPAWAWQYSDDGVVRGFEGNNIDLNLLEPAFIEWLGGTQVTTDIKTTPYNGVQRIVGRRYDSDIYVTIVETGKVKFEVAHELPFDNGLLYVSQTSRTKKAQFAWNGDEWDKNAPLPAYPKNLAVSKGYTYVTRKSAEPSLNVRQDNTAEIIHTGNAFHYNTSTGRRYLIENGVIKDYLYGSEPQYTERHPRGLTGLTSDKSKVIMITVDGRTSESAGVTLLEGAHILKEFGAFTAFDRGGGGDAVDVMDGVVQNVPCDTDVNGQPGVERAVPQAILVYAQKENTMASRYEATALGDNTRIRVTHDTSGKYVNSYPKGTKFQGNDAVDDANTVDGLFTAPTDLSNASGVYQRKGDQWLAIKTVNGQPPINMDSGQPMTNQTWVAVKHLGNPICTLVDNGTTPVPPPVNTVPVTVVIEIEGCSPLTLTGEAKPL